MSRPFRHDVQMLRGWAVLVVVLEHFGIGPFRSGYLGVDVFFVISGFVITNLLLQDISAGRFSFAEFYTRRAWRLLPTAFFTIAATCAVAPWFLGGREIRDLAWQAVGSAVFNANHILLSQGGYFDGPSGLKPLLHMWSLAIEEQFYLLFPLIIFFGFAKRRLIIWIGTVFSGFVCMVLLYADTDRAFYLLMPRAWELLIGAACAVTVCRMPPSGIKAIRRIAFAGIVALPMVPGMGPHPGLSAFLVCIATAGVLVTGSAAVFTARSVPVMGWLGDVSYSLYLAHWPLVAFMNGFYQPMTAGSTARLVVLGLAFLLAVLMHYGIEKPFRRPKVGHKATFAVSVAMALATMVQPAWNLTSLPEPSKIDRLANHGFSGVCDGHKSVDDEACRRGGSPGILVWGDSYAMHLVNGVARHSSLNVLQATFSSCGPTPGLAQDRRKTLGDARSGVFRDRCLAFNDRVLEVLQSLENVKLVVLSSPFSYYLTGTPMWRVTEHGLVSAPPTRGQILDSFAKVVEAARLRDAEVVVVGPTPRYEKADMGYCAEKLLAGRWLPPHLSGCVIDRAEAEVQQRDALDFLADLHEFTGVRIVDLFDVLCDEAKCMTVNDGYNLYQDYGHLSRRGSEYVVGRSGILGPYGIAP